VPRTNQFRVRYNWGFSIAAGLGGGIQSITIQEILPDGDTGRSKTYWFVGGGYAVGAKISAGLRSDWERVETDQPAALSGFWGRGGLTQGPALTVGASLAGGDTVINMGGVLKNQGIVPNSAGFNATLASHFGGGWFASPFGH
jgi:hypothetical protein